MSTQQEKPQPAQTPAHTPGPWSLGSAVVVGGAVYGYNIAGPDGYHVAKVSSRPTMAETCANGHLAAAAPELYDGIISALKKMQLLADNSHLTAELAIAIVTQETERARTKAEGRLPPAPDEEGGEEIF